MVVPNFWTRNAPPKHGKTVGGTANQSSSQAAKHLVFHPINGYLGAQNESSNLQMWMVSDQRSANSLDPEDKDLTLEADHLGIPSLKFSSFKGFPPKGKKPNMAGPNSLANAFPPVVGAPGAQQVGSNSTH